MYGFTTSELETVLIGLGVKRVAELSPHDTIRAMRLLLTERVPDSRSRMHVDPIDFDDRRVDGVFDLLADVTTARLKGRNVELPALYERIVDVLLAVVTDRLQDKVTQARQETLMLDFVERDVVRVQDPMMHGRTPQVIPGTHWDEQYREAVISACLLFHNAEPQP